MEFQQWLHDKTALIDTWLRQYLQVPDDDTKTVYEAMNYSVFAGGKRIRPVIMLAAYALFDENIDRIRPFACAMEMIHTFSLIHDDLPAMDNSTLRRGRPTNHMVYGDAMAVLAGDGLLSMAFEIMLESDIEPSAAMKAAAVMAKCTGNRGMIGGQVMDIQFEGQTIPVDTLKELHAKKTGALIRASAVVGAMIGGAEEGQIDALDRFAANLGLAFQIKDDILDATGDILAMGKPVGGDVSHEKNTYVSLLGMEKAQELLNTHTAMAQETLEVFGDKALFLSALTQYLLRRDN